MDSVRRINRRLVELGYTRRDAHAERDGSKMRLSGELVGEARIEPRAVESVVAMLPSKLRLLGLRLALSRRE